MSFFTPEARTITTSLSAQLTDGRLPDRRNSINTRHDFPWKTWFLRPIVPTTLWCLWKKLVEIRMKISALKPGASLPFEMRLETQQAQKWTITPECPLFCPLSIWTPNPYIYSVFLKMDKKKKTKKGHKVDIWGAHVHFFLFFCVESDSEP